MMAPGLRVFSSGSLTKLKISTNLLETKAVSGVELHLTSVNLVRSPCMVNACCFLLMVSGKGLMNSKEIF